MKLARRWLVIMYLALTLLFTIGDIVESDWAALWGTSLTLPLIAALMGRVPQRNQKTRVELDEKEVRLVARDELVSSAHLDQIHSLRWSKAPKGWPEMTWLELISKEGEVLLGMPFPVDLAPGCEVADYYMEKYPGLQRGQSLLKALRARCEGEEETLVGFEVSAHGERIILHSAIYMSFALMFAASYFIWERSGAIAKWLHLPPSDVRGESRGFMGALGKGFFIPTLGLVDDIAGFTSVSRRFFGWAKKKDIKVPQGDYQFAPKALAQGFVLRRIRMINLIITFIILGGLMNLVLAAAASRSNIPSTDVRIFILLAVGCFITAIPVFTVKRWTQALKYRFGDLFRVRSNGTLSVLTGDQREIDFPAGSGRWLYRPWGIAEYRNGTDSVITCIQLLEPADAPEEPAS